MRDRESADPASSMVPITLPNSVNTWASHSCDHGVEAEEAGEAEAQRE